MSDFPVSKDSYIAFDGLSIKEKIKQRLNQTGIFTDQNFEGSNLAALNDAFAMVCSLILYQVNQESTQGKLSQTSLYEVANKVVKQLSYNPIGYQTSTLTFDLSAQSLSAGTYVIPRYSYVDVAGINYSFIEDFEFSITENSTTTTQDYSTILYQGTYIEYPQFNPIGTANETVVLNIDDTLIVDNFNIDVYVKRDNEWKKWTKTQSLFLNSYDDSCYEVRFNEKKRYELKFGDNINGRQLKSDDIVAIYYLLSDGKDGEVGVSALNNKKLNLNLTSQFTEIINDIESNPSFITAAQLNSIKLNNVFPSTDFAEYESVESIKANAPKIFRSQYNLLTNKSFELFVRNNFSNVIHDVKVKNNKEYMDSYLKYFYSLGLTNPALESRALFNQINFSDSCSFNNIYTFIVPKSIVNGPSYLNPILKNNIIKSMEEEKILTSSIIPSDPIYIYFDIGISKDDINNLEDVFLEIHKSSSNRKSNVSIKEEINSVVNDFFNPRNNKLGQSFDFSQLTNSILNIDGIDNIYTINTKTSNKIFGIQLINWNPIYKDITVEESDSKITLEDFQFPILNNKYIVDKILIV